MMGTAKTNRDPPPPLFDSTVPFQGLASSMTKMSGAIPAGRQVSPSRAVHHRARATKLKLGETESWSWGHGMALAAAAAAAAAGGSPLAGRKRRPGWGARVNIHRLGSARLASPSPEAVRPPRPPCNDAPSPSSCSCCCCCSASSRLIFSIIPPLALSICPHFPLGRQDALFLCNDFT